MARDNELGADAWDRPPPKPGDVVLGYQSDRCDDPQEYIVRAEERDGLSNAIATEKQLRADGQRERATEALWEAVVRRGAVSLEALRDWGFGDVADGIERACRG